LLVTTDRREAGDTLATVEGVRTVEPFAAEPGRFRWALAGDKPASDLAPAAAAAIVAKGWSLYGLEPESRNLEKVFSDINLHAGREQ
jgi:hypothetical protein